MQSITHKIRAGYPGIYLTSFEEQRAESMIRGVADQLEYALHAWSCTAGRIDVRTGAAFGEQDPTEVLAAIHGLPEKTILLLRDFHLVLAEPNPIIYRMVKDACLHAKTAQKTIIILSPFFKLPEELSKHFVMEEFQLPQRDELQSLLTTFCESTGKPMPEADALDAVLDASMGLITTEAEDAYALSIIESGEFSPTIISREKAAVVKKNGLLEIIDKPTHIDQIGGLENLKSDLLSSRIAFTRKASQRGIPSPRGILCVGQGGTGKSLTAHACGSIFGIPGLRLPADNLFGSLVGQSEANWRSAFAAAKAIAPCVLWIDEADGLFSGARSSGSTDGGTTNRVVKTILQDMQFNSEGIFFVFTANDIDGFPDALIDRLDVWAVDLPTSPERAAIWRIHIPKKRHDDQVTFHDPDAFDVAAFAEASAGFSGRQIEQMWIKALKVAYNEDDRDPTSADVLATIAETTPTSVTMADSIEARRRRLSGKAKPASHPETVKPNNNQRKINA